VHKLVSDGCSARQHLILVQITINDLRGEASSPHYSRSDPRYVYYSRDEKCDPGYRDYYTGERKRQLIELQDSALRLVAARAAGMPYTGVIPSRRDYSGQMDAWNEAMEFWCSEYQECDTSVDNVLLSAALLQQKGNPSSSITKISSRNEALQVST